MVLDTDAIRYLVFALTSLVFFGVHVPVVKGEYNLLVPECHQGQPPHAAGFHGRPQLRLD